MCSGKVYYDLLEQRRKNNQHDVAIVRIEQLYPFPHKAMQEVLQQFAHVRILSGAGRAAQPGAHGTAASIISVK